MNPTRAIIFYVAVLAAVICAGGRGAAAEREVVIKWKTISDAKEYQLRVAQNLKIIKQLTVGKENRTWEGKFPVGVYVYEVRGVDRFNRPGQWTPAHHFFVAPPATKWTAPAGGAELTTFLPTVDTTLKWAASEGASSYRLEIKKNDQIFKTINVRTTEIALKKMPVGEYEAVVYPVVDAKVPPLPGLENKRWEGPASETLDFSLRQKTLEPPTPQGPAGRVKPSPENSVLTWSPVPGADRYRVKLVRTDRPTRGPAGETSLPEWKLESTEPHVRAEIPPDGTYRWEVTAVAKTGDETLPEVESAPRSADFHFQTARDTFGRSKYFSLNSEIFPYYYSVYSPSSGYSGATTAVASALSTSAAYWLFDRWGLLADFRYSFLQLGGISSQVPEGSLMPAFRVPLFGAERPLTLSFGFGLHFTKNVEVLPSTSGVNAGSRAIRSSAAGPVARLGLRKEFLANFEVESSITLAFQTWLIDGGYEGWNSGDHPNFSLDFQARYWWNPQWAITAGATYHHRDVSAFIGSGNSSNAERFGVEGGYYRLGILVSLD